MGHGEGLPENPPDDYESHEEFLKSAHHVLMEVYSCTCMYQSMMLYTVCVLEIEVVEGDLECPESGRKFPVTNGIPNMLLREDEV